ncbi:fungalysin/thermolysin propeptide/thermolysin metallopeptidase domain protein [Lysobacter enzymogenes]|uniref:Neutral metalloproteinase n=1 Tax=Lysobacter enzymogenes TaxID=69 RepID=A0A0S2DQS7_LYSEN|nr:M4 family metallopeptidase [Lysobacter enzymogenes]ALN60655.1 fungalysin/thermolysin propeptide/thermolysin metallopeptidase domain protein [Lysobacter enzymogenes]
MSIKHKVLTASILLAITGTTATALVTAQRDRDAGNAAAGANAQAAATAAAARNAAHAPAARASLEHPFADAAARSGATPAAQLERHPAVERARELLQADKARNAAARGLSGAGADTALAAERYQPRDVIVEADGSEHVRFQRDYQGLPVIGGDLVTHARNGLLTSISKTLDLTLGDGGAAPKPKLSSAQAIADAGVHFAGRFLEQPKSRMVYFAKDNQPTLAFEVTFRGLNKAQRPVHELLYVDAGNGDLLGRDSRIYSAESTEAEGYTITRGKVTITTAKVGAEESDGRGAGYLLRDDKRGGGTTHNTGGTVVDLIFGGGDFSAPAMFDADNIWGNEQMTNIERTGVEAHYGVARTWDYYKKFYDRVGIFGDGVGVQSFVNVTFSYFGIFDLGGTNAFWDGDAKRMVYGNGDFGVSNPVVAIDVAGHEMSHGVTQATSNLLYSGDAGGLNEATSDIHGTLVEFFDNSPKDPPDYLIGENVNLDGTPLRYMFKPSLDTDAAGNGSFDCYPAAGFTEEDPHYTSGVGNHFFYLLAEGQKVPKSHRKTVLASDLVCNGATGLKGLTPTVAGQIWYRANTLYLTSQSSYPDARVATQTAAQDLVDRGLLKASAVKTVACAWEAVNVGLPEGSDAARCKQ